MRSLICSIVILFVGCATVPKIHDIKNLETFRAPFERIWSIIDGFAAEKDWPIERREINNGEGILVSDWMSDVLDGGDFGGGGFTGQTRPGDTTWVDVDNIYHHRTTKQVAINIRAIRQAEHATQVKINCLFRIVTSKNLEEGQQSRFGTSKGVVEQALLDSIRHRL